MANTHSTQTGDREEYMRGLLRDIYVMLQPADQAVLLNAIADLVADTEVAAAARRRAMQLQGVSNDL